MGSPVRHVRRTARAKGEEPNRIQPGRYRGSGADLPTGEGIGGRGRRYRPSPPARPALTCPVAGLDFPPVLNSTEPAEIIWKGCASASIRVFFAQPLLSTNGNLCTPISSP